MDQRKIKEDRFKNFRSNIFLTAFFCYLVLGIISWSQLSHIESLVTLSKMLLYFSVLLIYIKILLSKYSYSSFLIVSVLFVFSLAYLAMTNWIYKDDFTIILFIIGARGVDFRKIIKVYLVTVLTAIVILLLLVKVKFIADITYLQGNELRHSLGFEYPLMGGSFSLFAGLSLVYLRFSKKFKLSKNWLTLSILVALFVLNYAGFAAKNASAILLLDIIFFLVPSVTKFIQHRWLLLSSIPVIIAINFLLPALYSKNYNMFTFLNTILSGRLSLERTALELYPIKLLGQDIPQVGVAGNTGMSLDYFYIDSSFFRLILMYGFIFFCLWILSQIIIISKTWKLNIILSLSLILIAIFGSVDATMIILYFNPFILAIMADFNKDVPLNIKDVPCDKT